MQVVGHHLQLEAIKQAPAQRDLFARSAYNRYYYAVFLNVRGMVEKLNPSWTNQPHKGYPELLKGSVVRKFKQARARAVRLSDHEAVSTFAAGISATLSLATLMETAYAIRIVADYHPLELVDFHSSSRFSLKSIGITEAHTWEPTARTLIANIIQAWAQMDG